jgi:hypothetical protein
MSTNETYLAVFLGSKTSPRMAAWNALPEEERRAKMQEGTARLRTRRPPSCSRSIRISRIFLANASRSCPFCRYRAPERYRPNV